MLDDRRVVKVLEDGEGVVHVRGREVDVWDSDETQLLKCDSDKMSGVVTLSISKLLERAFSARLSGETERNSESSRSHAFFVLKRIYRRSSTFIKVFKSCRFCTGIPNMSTVIHSFCSISLGVRETSRRNR